MELCDQSDDEEQQLVLVVNDQQTSEDTSAVDPFGPEMVAITSEMAGAEAPEQGSTTPRPLAAPDPYPQTPKVVPEVPVPTSTSDNVGIPNSLSLEAIQASLNLVMADSANILGNLPEVNSSLNLWENLNMGQSHFMAAPSSATPAKSMLAPIFTTMTEQERTKMTTDLIINCIQQQKVLWDSSDPNFGDSKLCTLLWSNIASVCGFNVKKLKIKWNTLKKTFRKEYIKSATTGVTSKSPNFAAMSFLEKEIQRELQRESREKAFAMRQLLRRNGGELEDVAWPSVVQPFEEDEEAEDIDDCMIVESEDKPSLSTTSDNGISSSRATSSKIDPVNRSQSQIALKTPIMIRPKDISELQKRRPSPELSTNNEHRRSPEVICLGDSKESQKTAKLQYKAVAGKPIIKFSPSLKPMENLVVAPGMPNTLPNSDLESQAPHATIKQCARKSISRGNLTLFPAQNGDITQVNSRPVKNKKATAQPQNANVKPEVGTENAMPWKIENIMTVDPSRTVKHQPAEPTRTEPPKPDSNKAMTPTPLKSPKLEPIEDDEIQIIMEVPRTSAHKTTNQPVAEPRKREKSPSQDQTPLKKPRTYCGPNPTPSEVAPKREVDKDREYSANEHFLLSLLYDVETLNKKQFRRLKKHSAALVSLILDTR